MEDFNNLFTVAILMLAMCGMAFVAYNHPRQFSWFVNVYATVFFFLLIAGWIFDHSEALMISRIKHSWLTSDQKDAVLKILKGPPPTSSDEFWGNLLYYGYFYTVGLYSLRFFGLTAEKRDAKRIASR